MKRIITLLLLVSGCFSIACANETLDLMTHSGMQPSGWQTSHKKLADGRYEVTNPARKPWPGFSLSAAKTFDAYRYDAFSATVTNGSDKPLDIFLTVADDKNKTLVSAHKLAPNETKTIEMKLDRKDDAWNKIGLKGMRTMPWMERIDETPNLRRVKRFGLSVNQLAAVTTYQVSAMKLFGAYQPIELPDPYFPMVDAYGQHKHKNWPGKIRSVEDLNKSITEELLEPFPSAGAYGGFKGGKYWPAQEHFSTRREAGKWTIVDPEGLPFFSFGMNSVNLSNQTPCEGRENYFEDFPGKGHPDAGFVRKATAKTNHGIYKGRNPWCIDLQERNFIRKYGQDWRPKVTERTLARLKSWGVNTIGAWADAEFTKDGHSYTLIIHPWAQPIEASDSYWGKFPDVFSPSFVDGITGSLKAIPKVKRNSPWCLGIFIDNELPWAGDLDLAVQTLQSPATQPAKREFVRLLQAQYVAIDELNKRWGTKHKSWEALLKSKTVPPRDRCKEDLLAFGTHLAETYFKTCRDLVRLYAPGRLYLGCRFAHNNAVASAAAVKYCDVVSVNLYYSPEQISKFALPGQPIDAAPLMIGEFHYGARDRGVARGLRGGETQDDRTQMTVEFLEAAANHPAIVGAHWFELYDQPITGRVKDGENYQIGFVDVTDTPYELLTQATRKAIQKLHETRYSSK